MGNSLQMFDFEGRRGRFVLVNGEPWFVAKDIFCHWITRKIITLRAPRRLSLMSGRVATDTHPWRNPEFDLSFRTGGLFLSGPFGQTEGASFPKKIAGEILPSIRKYGAYMTPQKIEEILTNPDTIIGLAEALKREQTKRKELAVKVESDFPKVLFADSVSASHTSILVGELAKLLRQNGVEVGQNRLFEILRNEGYLIRSGSGRNMPTQRAMERGLFEIKEITINRSDGGINIKRTTKVTGRGQVFFVNKFLAKKPLEI